MAEEIHELLVKLSPEGAEETTEALDKTSGQFKETAATAEEQSQQLDEFADKWQGAMATVTAGLAVAATGLLSTIPVLATVAQGLFAIIEAVGLKIDGVLRPALQPLADIFFDISAAILEMDGMLGDLVGVLGTLAAFIGVVVAPLLGLIAHFTSWATVLGSLSTVFHTVVGVIGTVVGILGGPLTLAILAIIAIATGLFLAWKTNFLGIRDIVTNVVKKVTSTLSSWWSTLSTLFSKGVNTLLNHGWNLFASLLAIVGKIKAAFRTGFETLFGLLVNQAKSWANSFVGIIEQAVNTAIRAIPKQIRSKLGLSTVNLGTPFKGTKSAGAILQSGKQRLDRRFESVERREQRRRDQNPFADRQQITLRIEPKELQELFSAETDRDVSFRGEGR